MSRDDLPLTDIVLLDKVQKEERISKEEAARLRKNHLVEGRYPNLYVAAGIDATTGGKPSTSANADSTTNTTATCSKK